MGKPLYFYSGDAKPGDVKGQGFNNVWYIATTTGSTPVVTAQPTTVPTTVRTTSPSYGYSGGGY